MAQWKSEERTVAKMFGTSRALMKGTDEKSDIISDLFMVDVKLRKRWEVDRWYRELKDAAAKEDKIPILTVSFMESPKRRKRRGLLYANVLINWYIMYHFNKLTANW